MKKSNKLKKAIHSINSNSLKTNDCLLGKDKLDINSGIKYISPIFSTVSGATYNLENLKR